MTSILNFAKVQDDPFVLFNLSIEIVVLAGDSGVGKTHLLNRFRFLPIKEETHRVLDM